MIDEREPAEWQPPDPSRWSDAQFERAVALAAYTRDIDEQEADETPDYEW